MKMTWILVGVILSFIGLSNSHPGFVFVPKHKIFSSFSTWTLNFVIDIQNYQLQINNLKSQVTYFKRTVLALKNKNSNAPLSKFDNQTYFQWLRPSIQLIDNELRQFALEFDRLENMQKSIKSLAKKSSNKNSKTKRAILPIVGDLLSNLFGLMSEKDMTEIANNVLALKQSQLEVMHVLQKGLTMINQTAYQAESNRKSIYRIANVTALLSKQLFQLASQINQNMEMQFHYERLMDHLAHLSRVVSATLRQTYESMNELEISIFDALQGKLSVNLVSPKKLKNILQKIDRKSPQTLSLPYSAEKSIDWYYRNLIAMLVPHNHSFHILTAVPLIQENMLYDIYQIVSVPVVHLSKQLTVEYKIDKSYLAISADRNYYTIMDLQSISSCLHVDVNHCDFQEPLYPIHSRPSCLTALFLNQHDLIDLYCIRKYGKTLEFPVTKYLTNGTWMIASNESFIITQFCSPELNAKTTPITITPPVSIITLQAGCIGNAKYFQLPPYYRQMSTEFVKQNFHIQLQSISKLPSIWTFNMSTPLIVPDPIPLPDILLTKQILNHSQTQIDELQDMLLNAKRRTEATGHFSFNNSSISMSVIIVLAICFATLLIVFIIVIMLKRRRERFLTKSHVVQEKAIHIAEPQPEIFKEPSVKYTKRSNNKGHIIFSCRTPETSNASAQDESAIDTENLPTDD